MRRRLPADAVVFLAFFLFMNHDIPESTQTRPSAPRTAARQCAPTPRLELERSVRFGLHEPSPTAISANSFAANPILSGLVPFVDFAVRIRGAVDESTGMLINIRAIDQAVRAVAAPQLLAYYHRQRGAGATPETSPAGLLPGLARDLARDFNPHEIVQLTLSLSPYLRLQSRPRELPMVCIVQSFEFSAAHRLYSPALSDAQNAAVFGKCTNPNGHGHNYQLDVAVSGPPDAVTGVVIPIHALQEIVNREIISAYDHKHLNLDCPDFAELNPTVENIARVIFNKLQHAFPPPITLASVRVWETPKTWCQCSAAEL